MNMADSKTTIGFALTGSFCTFSRVIPQIEALCKTGYDVIPILSPASAGFDTRFGIAEEIRQKIEDICQRTALTEIPQSEPIGPKNLISALIIAPCTGNTLSKLANGITDTNVTMAAKSTLRNSHPVVIAVSTNDALSGSAVKIGRLLNTKGFYFVPASQDDPENKPRSVVADFSLIPDTLKAALSGEQIQPLLKTER